VGQSRRCYVTTLQKIEAVEELLELRNNFTAFFKKAWEVFEPTTELVWNFHQEAICEHLQAMKNNKIQRLLVALPPRHSKSSIISVAFPAWIWITNPSERFLCASYAMSLALRDSQRCRELVDSEWYQSRFGDSFKWLPDQNQVRRFENTARGFRLATSIEGAATGEGGSWILVDDPHNIQEGESDAIRVATLSWWDRVMTSRLNNQQTGKMVIIGQRVHEEDLIGHLLETGDWEYLCLPAEYESTKKTVTSIGWQDPREKDGEPLWKDKFPKSILSYLKKTLGVHYFSQYQQRPVRDSGNIFKAAYFFQYTEYDTYYLLHTPDGQEKQVLKAHCRTVISTDLALSEKAEADYTVFLTWAVTPNMEFLLIDIFHERLEAPEAEELLWNKCVSARRFWAALLEDVAYQKSTIQRLRRGTPVAKGKLRKGIPVIGYHPTVDKVSRAQSMVVWFSSGNFYFNSYLAGYADFKKELLGFPRVGKDDFVDAVTICNKLLEYGEPMMTNYDEIYQMTAEEEAIKEISKTNAELASFLAEEDNVEYIPWWT
jgi:predicted phage terminase large subunit-like protein